MGGGMMEGGKKGGGDRDWVKKGGMRGDGLKWRQDMMG